MDGDSFIKAVLSLLAYREERSNGINGMSAVMFVVRNRVKAGWSGGDWGKVIEGHNQFSSISIAGDSQTVVWPDIRDPLFQKVLQSVDSIYDGTAEDTLTNGSLYYADLTRGVQPGSWFDRVIVGQPEKFPRAAQVGTTTFFKEA